jgi:hypothetical protein
MANSNTPNQENSPALVAVTGFIGLSARTRGLVHLIKEKVLAQFSDEVKKEGWRWVLDNGMLNHMTGVQEVFTELDTNVCGTVKFGDGSMVEIEGIGTIMFVCKTGEHKTLSGVYLIPKLTTNIISLGQMDELRYEVVIRDGVMWVCDEQRRLMAKVQRSSNRLYVLSMQVSQPISLMAKGADSAWLWHARFGHLNFRALRRLAREELVRGLPEVDQVEQLCSGCLMGKKRRAPFPQQSEYRADNVLELVHGDICGPISPTTPRGNRYFIMLVDDVSRFMWVKMLQSKDQAADAIKQYQAATEAETRRKLRAFRSDRGGEFTSAKFAGHCAEHGVRRQLTTPYTTQQNCVVEQRNQTVATNVYVLTSEPVANKGCCR